MLSKYADSSIVDIKERIEFDIENTIEIINLDEQLELVEKQILAIGEYNEVDLEELKYLLGCIKLFNDNKRDAYVLKTIITMGNNIEK